MPVYAYRCPRCGPFDERRDADEASTPASCPDCSETAKRIYTAPGIRSKSGVLAAATKSDRARVDRARTGAPSLGLPSTGYRPPSRPHVH